VGKDLRREVHGIYGERCDCAHDIQKRKEDVVGFEEGMVSRRRRIKMESRSYNCAKIKKY
jgi:hypothetical protein